MGSPSPVHYPMKKQSTDNIKEEQTPTVLLNLTKLCVIAVLVTHVIQYGRHAK